MSSVVEQLTEVTPAEARAAKAEAVMRAAGLEPLEPYPGTGKPWRCRCSSCGETVGPHFKTVAMGGSCNACARKTRATTRKANATAKAEAVMRAAGLEPLEPYPGSAKPWRCRCSSCGETVTPRHNDVLSRGSGGCRACGHRDRGLERLTAAAPAAEAVMRAAGLEPLEPYPGSAKPWRCRCSSCGETVTPRHNDVLSHGSGCNACAARGFQDGQTGYVYLLQSETLRAYKVGITNNPSKRLDEHCKYEDQSWEVCLLLRFSDGAAARSLEQRVIKTWRAAGWAEAVPADLMPQDGFTETVAMVDAGPVSAVLDQLGASLAD